MEKLQMAAHAIGDVEALLQGSDIGDGGDDVVEGFEEKILKLVLATLAGKDVAKATLLAEKSIEDAKAELEREQANIDQMLGGTDGTEYVGPRAPTLPKIIRSMSPREFALKALGALGSRLTSQPSGLYLAEENGGREYIRFEEATHPDIRSTFYNQGTPAFQRLVSRIAASGIHRVEDLDQNAARTCEQLAREWSNSFGAKSISTEIDQVHRKFDGSALVLVRATVAHDSYERLVDISCSPEDHRAATGRSALDSLSKTIERPETIGLDVEKLKEAARLDDGISEFSRFYLERREQETKAAGEDDRKRKKLQDEFTPRLEMMLVGLEGRLHREVKLRTKYNFDSEDEYESVLTVTPHNREMVGVTELGLCSKSGRTVPNSCLSRCEITGAEALRHLLVKSDISGRLALPEFTVLCARSGKRLFRDEAEISTVTGNFVSPDLVKTSALSGKRAEPEHFGICSFTNAELLKDELAISDISGKSYRIDQQMQSIVSGKAGHKQEFVICHETRQPISLEESERCDITGYRVRIGILDRCEISGKKVLPIGLDRCTITGKRALKRFLVNSSVSGARILEDIAIRSSGGLFCARAEVKACVWSGRKCQM
jgi:hypothetical protein